MSFHRMIPLLAAPMLIHAAGPTSAAQQAPHAAWRTIRTAHYRIHYPPVFADWAQDVASRAEGVHAEVVKLVGFESPVPIQLLLMDPQQEPNGLAVSLLQQPFVILWRTPPLSDQLSDTLRDWTEELLAHELTHIHHLTRPQNHPGFMERLLPIPLGPIAQNAPIWLVEGYATLAEGKLTGSGRPHSLMRAAILRQWSIQGKLPAFDAMNSDGPLGRTTAYMVGSAYLEWLERQRPDAPDILQRFWKQLCSRKRRGFEASFQATFGFSARDGYDRFRAELAHDALEWESSVKAKGLREGELWMRSGAPMGGLEVSPDGHQLLVHMADPSHPGLRVWDLKEKSEASKEAKPHESDPNELEDAPPECKPHALLAGLPSIDFQIPHRAQWVDDRTISLMLKHRNPEGVLERRAALWHVGESLDRQPLSIPAGRNTFIQPILRKGRWILDYRGQEVPLPGQPLGRAVLDASKAMLYVSCAVEGTFNLVRIPVTDTGFGDAQQLTRTASAATNPAPSPDGKTIYFTLMDARGSQIRRMDLAQTAMGKPTSQQDPAMLQPRLLTTATIQAPAIEPGLLTDPVPGKPHASEPYCGVSNLRTTPIWGATSSYAGESVQMGAGGSDLLGRVSWQAMLSEGRQGGPSGAVARFTYSGWAWKTSAHAFLAREKPSAQRGQPKEGLDRERMGGEVAFTREDASDQPWWIHPSLAWERDTSLPDQAPGMAPERSTEWNRTVASLRLGAARLKAYGDQGIQARIDAQWSWDHTDRGPSGNDGSALRAALTIRYWNPVARLSLCAEGGRIQGNTHDGNINDGRASEGFRLGGLASPLVSRSLEVNHVEQAALPAWSATGDRFLRWRSELGSLFRLYAEGTVLWNAGQDRGPFQRVVGVELHLDEWMNQAPLQLRKLTCTLGAHRIVDGPMKKREVITLCFSIRP